MSDELITRLQRLHGVATAMRGLIHEAQAAAPARSRAKDASGAVTVVLDSAGLPVKILVAQGWQQQLSPASLGAALSQACSRAARIRVQAWARALESGAWGRKVARMMRSEAGPVPPADGEVPILFQRDQATARPLGDLAEEMINTCAGVRANATVPAEFSGSDRGRHVTIVLSAAGLTTCRVDARWAEGRTGSELSTAASLALTAARAALQTGSARRVAESARPPEAILSEALWLIRHPERLVG